MLSVRHTLILNISSTSCGKFSLQWHYKGHNKKIPRFLSNFSENLGQAGSLSVIYAYIRVHADCVTLNSVRREILSPNIIVSYDKVRGRNKTH